MTNNDLTPENFMARTGFRFRVSQQQKAQIEDGTMTREEAFQAFIENNGVKRLQDRPKNIPDSVYLDPYLTLENFSDKVEAVIGVKRRFRVSREQFIKIKAGTLTREQALAEVVMAKQSVVPVVETISVGTETTGG